MADESAKGILGHLPPLPRKELNNSVIAMEQAYRQRKGLALLSDADIEALKAGVPMSWEAGGTSESRACCDSSRGRGARCRRRNQRRGRQMGRAGKKVEQVGDCG
jgi:hypothetical protein